MSNRLPLSALWNLVPRPVLGFEAALLVALFLLFRARSSLGIPVHGTGIEQILTVGLFLLVANHLAWTLSALAKQAGSTGLGKTTWPFFVLPLMLYLVVLPWSTSRRGPDGDEPYYLLIAHSLAYDLDTELTNNYAQQDSLRFVDRALEPSWADPVRPDGKAFSRHSPALPLLLAPGYRLASRGGALITMVLLTALASWLAFRLARRYWPRQEREIVWAWALLALTPPMLLYSHQIWVEVPATILLLIALGQLLSLQDASASSRKTWWILVVTIVLLPALKLRFLLLSGPLLILAWWRSGRSRKILVGSGIGLASLVGGLLVLNQMTTGKWLRDHSVDQLLAIQARPPIEYLNGATGLLWDCAFGLFASNPAWLLLIPALLLVLWQRRPIALDLLVLGLPYLMVVAPRAEWYGAWSPPYRFGMVFLPLLAMALVPLLASSQRVGARALTTISVALGTMLSLLWLAEPGWTYNLATGTNHLLDHLAWLWSADAARFFPSQVRPRTASWFVPLLVGSAVVLFWWWPKRTGGWQPTGIALLLLALAVVPLAAHFVPTQIIEMEDRQVTKIGGELYPEVWVPYRPRFRGGWRLVSGESVSAPVVTGGGRVSIELELMLVAERNSPLTVELRAGDEILATERLGAGSGWQAISFADLDWVEGAPLELSLGAERMDEAAEGSVVFDRATLRWH